MTKFKKLKKTKEEMTKFCMRKAFKYVNESKKGPKKRGGSLKVEEEEIEFELPFK